MRLHKPTVGCYLAVVPSGLLAWRLVREQTSLSWEQGPQMVGFTLVHGPGLLLLIALVGALAWAAVTVLITIFSSKRRNLANFAGAVMVAVAASIASAPYGLWVRLFADRIAHGEHATAFLVHMAILGDIPATQALLDHGVPINRSNASGIRPIEAAENAGRSAMHDFLAQRGGTAKRF